MTMIDACPFCRIIAREAPAYILHEDAQVIVFLSLEGHPLVVPKAHIPDILTLDDETAGAVMRTTARVARAVMAGLGCEGVYLTQANGAAAGQDVFHFHLHIYPRWRGDGFRVSIPPRDIGQEAKQETQQRIRAALDAEQQIGRSE
jgi:histidine triad (HIT) family protein